MERNKDLVEYEKQKKNNHKLRRVGYELLSAKWTFNFPNLMGNTGTLHSTMLHGKQLPLEKLVCLPIFFLEHWCQLFSDKLTDHVFYSSSFGQPFDLLIFSIHFLNHILTSLYIDFIFRLVRSK